MKKVKHIESKYMRLKIVHKEVSDVATGTLGKTWKERTVKFAWNITRPETGMEAFSTTCPVCGEKLKIDVTSTQKFTSQLKKTRGYGIAGLIGCLVLGVLIYIFIRADNTGLAVACIVGFMICFVTALAGLGSLAEDPWGMDRCENFIWNKDSSAGAFDSHYVDDIEAIRA